jgi:glycine/D-amino acid oxidase-like deaminating enzyme
MDAGILIIGGGLLGCAGAWHLAQAGLSPLVIESGPLNGGASGQNAGSLHFQIERRFLEQGTQAAELGSSIVTLNRLAIAEWAELEQALGRPLDIHMHGGLMVAESEADMALLSFKVARENAMGLPTELLDAAALRAQAPYLSRHLHGAAWLASEGHANPRILATAFAQGAQRHGARFLTHTRLIGLRMVDDGTYEANVQTPEGTRVLRAAKIMLASGHWSSRIASFLGLNLPLYPVPLTMNVTDRTRPFLPWLIQHVGRRLSMKQTADGNIVIGGGWASRLAKGRDGLPDLDAPAHLVPDNVRANLAVAADVFPGLRQRSLLRSWTGITCISADQLPIVGMVDAAPGLYVAAGGSMFTLGPLVARLLAGAIASGIPAPELAPFSPRRFAHLNAFTVLP